MITAANLAGFFAAHAVWSVSSGDELIPMLAHTAEGGERTMERLANEDVAEAVELGKQKLAQNSMAATDAVLIYDGRITLDSGKYDALILELRSYFSPNSEAMIAIPYTPKTEGPFAVHKPKLLTWQDCDDFKLQAVFEAFFNGVAGHEKGAKIWNDCLDESR